MENPAPAQPTSEQSSPKPERNWKKVLLFLLLFLFLTSLVGVGIYLLIPRLTEQPAQNTTTNTKTATQSATPNVLSNWKTIRGEVNRKTSGVHKFKFKAPEEFKITSRKDLSSEWKKYYFNAEGNGIIFFAGLMEGPGPLTTLYSRADKSDLCTKPLELQELSKGVFEVCDTIDLDGRKALWLIDVHIGSNSHASACERNASLHVVYNLDVQSSLFFTLKLDVLKEIIEPWDKVSTKTVGLNDEGENIVCPEGIDYSTVKENLAVKINSIRNAEGLSENDNQRLQILYQILPTFRFLN